MGNGIQKSTFIDADSKTQSAMTFDLLHDIKEHIKEQGDVCNRRHDEVDKRILKLERRKTVNAAASAGGGVVGGFVAYLTSKLWG